VTDYHKNLRLYILPEQPIYKNAGNKGWVRTDETQTIGAMDPDVIDEHHVDVWLNSLQQQKTRSGRPLSDSTRDHARRVFSLVMTAAIEAGLRSKAKGNPVSGKRVAIHHVQRREPITEEGFWRSTRTWFGA
jgi:hypothetical protein